MLVLLGRRRQARARDGQGGPARRAAASVERGRQPAAVLARQRMVRAELGEDRDHHAPDRVAPLGVEQRAWSSLERPAGVAARPTPRRPARAPGPRPAARARRARRRRSRPLRRSSSSSASSVSPRASSSRAELAREPRVVGVELERPAQRLLVAARRRARRPPRARAASKKRSTSAGGSAPVNSLATWPSRNALTAGIPWIREAGGRGLVGVHVHLGQLDLARRAPRPPLERRARAAGRARTSRPRSRPPPAARASARPRAARSPPRRRRRDRGGSTDRSALHELRALDDHGLQRVPAPPLAGSPSSPIASTTSLARHDLPEHRVVGRQAGVRGGHDVELAARRAGRLGRRSWPWPPTPLV